jgi:Fe2+ transport system protein FeoA
LALALPGKAVILVAIHGGRGLRARLNSMGLNEGMKLKVLHSHGHGPCVIQTVEIRAGIIDYVFPNVGVPETREVFVVAEYPNGIITPCIEGYYDFDEAGGALCFHDPGA